MRILLIYPSILNEAGSPIKYQKALVPTLGLATLAGLTPREHQVKIVNDLVEDVPFHETWDLVGITGMTTQINRGYQIADRFRAQGVPVVIGGVHASMQPEDAQPHADAIVVGEAEEIWPEVLADAQERRLKLRYQHTRLADLQRVIPPRWEGANFGAYQRRWGAKFPIMPIFTTRGCPHGCNFCTVSKLFGRRFRTRAVDAVLAEIAATGADEFFFVDDNVAANPDYARDLFGQLRPRGIRWMGQASTTLLRTPDVIERAGESGCFGLFIGVESLNPASLGGAAKSFNCVDGYKELIGRLRRAGIKPILSFMFGFDEDRPDEFELTLSFLREHRVGTALFFLMTPLPGTVPFDQMQQAGRLRSLDWSRYDCAHMVFQPKTGTAEELEARYWAAFQQLYRPPQLYRNMLWDARGARHWVQALARSAYIQRQGWLRVQQRQHPYSGGAGLRTFQGG